MRKVSTAKYLDHELLRPHCGTIYLLIPEKVRSDTLIHGSTCGTLLGTFANLSPRSMRRAANMAFSSCATARLSKKMSDHLHVYVGRGGSGDA